MTTFLSKSGMVLAADILARKLQRSWAILSTAEKGKSPKNPSNLLTSVQPVFMRLDGGNPHQYWLRLTSQPFYSFLSHTCARSCARIRVYACIQKPPSPYSPIAVNPTTTKQVRQVRRLGRAFVYKGFSRLTFRLTFWRLDE